MQIIEISKLGEIIPREINRKTLVTEFDLHLRDLRPVFSKRQVTTMLRRGQGLILNFKSVKMIVGADRVLLFNLENPRIVDQFAPMLSRKISDPDEGISFELTCLDAGLTFVLMRHRAKFEHLQKRTEQTLSELEQVPTDENLTQLLQLKKQLSNMESRAQEAEDMVVEILHDDKEVASIFFVDEPDVAAIEEAESVLENNLEQLENISHQIDELNENIDDTQEILTMKLANRRNDIIRFDLIISVMTAIFSILAVIVGLFGTNIRNQLENSHAAFWVLTIALFVIFASLWILIWRYMKNKKLL